MTERPMVYEVRMEDVEAIAAEIEDVDGLNEHNPNHAYARAAIEALLARGWRPPVTQLSDHQS